MNERSPCRVLIVVAPTLHQAWFTTIAFGITPGLSAGLRYVTKAHQLRSWSRGTPYIAQDRFNWSATPAGLALDEALDILTRLGKLRIANPEDLAQVGANVFSDGDSKLSAPIAPTDRPEQHLVERRRSDA